MHRIPNMELIESEKRIVDLIGHFRVVSFEQMHRYHVLTKQATSYEQVMSKMRHLAVKYHFSCFEEEERFAFYRTDLAHPGGIAPMWVYLDFLEMGIAGAQMKTNIPYTPVVFEQTDECELIELVCVPDEKAEIMRMKRELYLYDRSLEDGEDRRRILIVTSEKQIKDAIMPYCFIAAWVTKEGIIYIPVEAEDEETK